MLARVKILPLCQNGGVGFKIKIGFAMLYSARYKQIKYTAEQHRVKTRILILGSNGNKSEIHNLRMLCKPHKLDNCRESESASALFKSITDRGEAKTECYNLIILIAYKDRTFDVDNEHELLKKLCSLRFVQRYCSIKLDRKSVV